MGTAAVITKVFPESPEVFEKVKSSIQNEMKPYKLEEEEVAFGIKALKVTILVKDSSGGSDIEERLRKIEGVSEVQVEEVTLI
ncbi:elongation factor 1-beta [Candidatus Micrarchaeota archaeon]|jgi:elongation factor 1-beta|nr:elongation factor 1-beta [Candidatus Micrarchaeota archaeon]